MSDQEKKGDHKIENKTNNPKSNKKKSSPEKDSKIIIQDYINPPSHDPSKDKVTKGLTNDECTLGGSDTFLPNFPDS